MQKDILQIPLDHLELGLILKIYPEGNAVFREIDILEAQEFSESQYQILEGNSYEYNFNNDNFQLGASISGIVIPSRIPSKRNSFDQNHHLVELFQIFMLEP
jgi:hypothetical protein